MLVIARLRCQFGARLTSTAVTALMNACCATVAAGSRALHRSDVTAFSTVISEQFEEPEDEVQLMYLCEK
jgi:hypothetical protein